MKTPEKILIIQTAFIGDLIISTPVFRELRNAYPGAEVHVLAIPSSASIIKHDPHIDKIHIFDKKSGSLNKLKSFLSLVNKFKKERFDLGISLQNSFTSSLLMKLSGVKYFIGGNEQKFSDENVFWEEGIHSRLKMLEYLKQAGIKVKNTETEIHLSEHEINKAESIIRENKSKDKIKIGISPGSVRETKKWREEHYTKLTAMLDEKDFHVYFFGSPAERSLTEKTAKNSGAGNNFNYAGELGLLESAALMKKMDLMLTNDSAPLHIANAVKTDVFAFFGPTVEKFGFFPYREKDYVFQVDLDCRPCSLHGGPKCPLGHHNCMKMIAPEMVYEKIKEKFSGETEQ